MDSGGSFLLAGQRPVSLELERLCLVQSLVKMSLQTCARLHERVIVVYVRSTRGEEDVVGEEQGVITSL